jgi:hypothetical protein
MPVRCLSQAPNPRFLSALFVIYIYCPCLRRDWTRPLHYAQPGMSRHTFHASMSPKPSQVSNSRSAYAGPSSEYSLREGSFDSSLTPLPSEAKIQVYVELQKLKPEERGLYARGFSERPMTDEEAFPKDTLKAVVGEALVKKEMYYFVKLVNGQVFKVRS